jgi:parallel beta-helix repeat protein
LIISFLFVNVFVLTFGVQQVKAEPKTWTVDDDGPADFHTIKEAINAAGTRDTVFVRSGTYSETETDIYRPLTLIGENKYTTIIDGKGSWVSLYVNSAYDVTIQGFAITNGFGIYSYQSTNVTIQDNVIKGNGQGIILISSTGNTIKQNIIIHNSLPLLVSEGSTKNEISENIVAYNSGDAIWLDNSHENIIRANTVFMNGLGTAPGYHVYGIRLSFSNNNRIYHNGVIDNYEQADSWMSTGSMWDNGYPSGGNYWSDYNGTDSFRGSYQNVTGSDGIGDTPYAIQHTDEVDRYPLLIDRSIRVKMLGDVNFDGIVDLRDVYAVARAFGKIPGKPRWNLPADENQDGAIDLRDVYTVYKNYGKAY